jgi:hypothetical protein
LTPRGEMLRSSQQAARGGIRAGSRQGPSKDRAIMASYAAKELLLTQQAPSDLRSELLYPDLHGALPNMGLHVGRGGKDELQPAEKKLIGFSFGIGLVLLAALVIVNHLF